MSGAAVTIERRMARSAAWMIGLRLADRSIGMVSVLFLARLLAPADFGLVAMGTVILGALEAVSAFGFEMALIKRQAKDRARWDSAWTLNVIIGAATAGLMAALAPAAAAFYGEPRVTHVMLVLSASALVSGMRNIGMVEFEQDLRFGPIVILALARRLCSFVLTLALAWWYGSYWALLAGMVTGHMIDLLLSYQVSAYRPRFSLVAWRDLFSFSKWVLVNNMLSYAGNRGGDVIVGNRAGAAALGTYAVSLELSNLPTSEMVWPVMRAVFPGYAMMSADPKRLAQGFLKVFSIVVLFAMPAAAGIALLAEPLVAVLLGPKWSDAVPLIQVLAIAGGIKAAQANAGSVYMALDRQRLASGITLVGLFLQLGSFSVALSYLPLAEAAWFLVAGGLIAAIINLTIMTRMLGLSWIDVIRPLTRPAVGIVAMSAVLALLCDPLWNSGHAIGTRALILVTLVLTGAAVYMLSVLLAWRLAGCVPDSPEGTVLAVLKSMLRRRTA
ncbi:MAG: lipopolysaccharide biosynthesis protein [Burkholderiaceae bacterium]